MYNTVVNKLNLNLKVSRQIANKLKIINILTKVSKSSLNYRTNQNILKHPFLILL